MGDDAKKIRRRLVEQGFELRYGGKHIKIYRKGRFITTMTGGKVSDVRGLKNLVAHLRREGYEP